LSASRDDAGGPAVWAPLPEDFFARDVLSLARSLLGKVLVHVTEDGLVAGRIVETEAYRGPEDRAAHSAHGRRTARVAAMWGPPGHAYVFLLYGMHWAFNVVAGEEGEPHAVLVRALEPLAGVELMARRRSLPPGARTLTNGPGKLCAAMGIDKRHYGTPLFAPPLYVADGRPGRVRTGRGPRINVDYAEHWADRPWRFWERGNPWVSVKPRD
jgi:DNA-3-methyladenine glycosylase